MYKATLFVETGFGLDYLHVKADSYKEVTEKVEKLIARGKEVLMPISKVVFNYPSGKTFTKKVL